MAAFRKHEGNSAVGCEAHELASKDASNEIGQADGDHNADVSPSVGVRESKRLGVLEPRHTGLAGQSTSHGASLMPCNTLCWDEVIMARETQVVELATEELIQMSVSMSFSDIS